MTDLFILAIFLCFVTLGLSRPFVAVAGYVWVDILAPQTIAYSFLANQPLSMYMAALLLFSAMVNHKQITKPKSITPTILIITFACWVSYTTTIAFYPDFAWTKWDWAFKSILVSVFITLCVSSRAQLELCIITFSMAAGYYIMAAGTKSIFGGGGYGVQLIQGGANTGISESSTLSMVAVLIIPVVLFMKDNSKIFDFLKEKNFLWAGVVVLCLATVMGTRARTGLVALAVYACLYLLNSKKKLRNIIVLGAVLAVSFVYLAPEDWKNRMGTLKTIETEDSAMNRIHVWRWTWDFVKQNPKGGGFNAYLENAGEWQLYSDYPIQGNSFKAFHNIYFEVLGEHGYPGIILFFMIILSVYRQNRLTQKNEFSTAWDKALAKALNHCLIIYCISGMFIGIAFQPILYLIAAFSFTLNKVSFSYPQKSIEKSSAS